MRRKNRHTDTRRYEDGSRNTVPETQMTAAIQALDKAWRVEATQFVPHFTREGILNWLFPDDKLARLRAVRGMVDTANHKSYEILPDVDLHLNFDGGTTPAIEPNVFFPNPGRVGPLLAAIRQVDDLRFKYGRVKHLLRWFNKNATPGAIRNYWPAACALCPQAPFATEAAPTRYTTPPGIAEVLPLIRETAGTVATLALLPNDGAAIRERGSVWLSFDAGVRDYEGHEVQLDQLFFNL